MAGFHEVLVTNIGKVFESDNGFAARVAFNSYVGKSKRNEGRAAGESVTLWTDGEIIKEFHGRLEQQEGFISQ